MQKKTNYVKLDQDNNDRPTDENEEIHNLKVSLLRNTNLPLRNSTYTTLFNYHR